MNYVENRRKMLINFTFFALIVVAYCLFFKYAFGLFSPFIISVLIAMMLQKPIKKISDKTHIKRSYVAVALVLVIVLAILGLMIFAGYKLVVEFRDFGAYVIQRFNDLPSTIAAIREWIFGVIAFLPDKIEMSAKETITDFTNQLISTYNKEGLAAAGSEFLGGKLDISMLSSPLDGIWSTAKKIPSVLMAILIGIISCFFVTADYKNLTDMIKNSISDETEEKIIKTKNIFFGTVGKMVKSYATIIFITFCEVAIGLNILKLIGIFDSDYILVISICTAIVDILPILGTGTIMIPWAVISLVTGDIPLAIGLLVIYALITVIRQVLEPRLVAMNVGVPPIVTLFGMYIGLQLFGVVGLFVLPITFVLIQRLNEEKIIHLWGGDKNAKNTQQSEKKETKKQASESKK